MVDFKSKWTFEQRTLESARLREKFLNRIPVVIKAGNKSSPPIDKYKYLVPGELTLGEFIYILRKRIKLHPAQALFVFIDGILPPVSKSLRELYAENADPDGFLYLSYSLENTFG
jgi:GABA(A) receptor-associated protein